MPKADSCWSFSLRGRGIGDIYPSDDDSEADGKTEASSSNKPSNVSEEARLLGELDLASRTDAATFKPNPWSIAKVNAATRPPKPSRTAPKKPALTMKSKKATVLDLLRNQTEKTRISTRAPHNTAPNIVYSPRSQNAMSSSHHPDNKLDASFEEGAHIPSDETLVDVSYQPSVLCKTEPDIPSVTSTWSIPSNHVPTAHNRRSRAPTYDSARTVGSPANFVESEASTIAPHAPFLGSSGLRRVTDSLLSLDASPRFSEASNGLDVGNDVTSLASRTSDPSGRMYELPVFKVVWLTVLYHFVTTALEQVHGSNSSAVIVKPSWKREWRSPDPHSHPCNANFASSLALPTQSTYTRSVVRGTSSPVIPDQSMRRDISVTKTFEDRLPRLPSPSCGSGSLRPRLCRNTKLSTPYSVTHAGSSVIPAPLKMHSSPKKFIVPSEPSRVRIPSLSPSPPTVRHASYTSKEPPPKRNAYDAFGSPHDSWSTIPVRKARTRGKNNVRRQAIVSGKFKIPVLGTPLKKSRAQGDPDPEINTFRVEKRPKAMSYLPPPPKPVELNRDLAGHEPRCHASEAVPNAASSSSGFQPLAVRRAVPPPLTLSAYKYNLSNINARSHPLGTRVGPSQEMKTPPPSSPTLLSPAASPRRHISAYTSRDQQGQEMAVPFSTSGVSSRYSSVRRKVTERKRLSADVWDILDLPSCGVIFRDEWRKARSPEQFLKVGSLKEEAGLKSRHKQEIRIVVWHSSKNSIVTV
ncbi:hypothetical protein BC628DRAFT_1319052 [Trametes gibbosa]|nr:hypothetical protein BC628DRAFT_1319052 [Trametes gibbosa]